MYQLFTVDPVNWFRAFLGIVGMVYGIRKAITACGNERYPFIAVAVLGLSIFTYGAISLYADGIALSQLDGGRHGWIQYPAAVPLWVVGFSAVLYMLMWGAVTAAFILDRLVGVVVLAALIIEFESFGLACYLRWQHRYWGHVTTVASGVTLILLILATMVVVGRAVASNDIIVEDEVSAESL